MQNTVSIPHPHSVKNNNANTPLPGSKRNAIIFIVKAIVFSSVLMGIYLAIPSRVWTPVQEINAKIAGSLLSVFSDSISVNGSVIQSNTYSVQIIDQCLAIDITLLLIAFILAFPSGIGQKLVALGCGIPAVLGANTLRILFVFLIGSARPDLFNLAHLYFGQIFMLCLLSSLFILWILSMTHNPIVRNRAVFILKLFGFSSVLFVVWSFLHKPFVGFTEGFLAIAAQYILGSTGSSFGAHEIYEYTFNFVTFTSLILASDSITIKRKWTSILWGNGVLFIFQILFRVIGIFAAGLKSYAAYKISIGIFEFAGFLLPVLLWILVRYWRNAVIVCPLCGVQRNGIEEHIRKKHGADALERDDVKAMFGTLRDRYKGVFLE